MKIIFLVLCLIVSLTSPSTASDFKKSIGTNVEVSWVSVDKTTELYTEYYPPQKNKPTLVLIHGLTYTTRQWKSFIHQLVERGYGVVCYDMRGMGQTLLKYAPVRAIIPMTNQAEDLAKLLAKLKIPKPYNLIGLSYGGGVAFNFAVKYPKLTGKLILMAPYTKPLEQVDAYIKAQVAAARLANPFNPFTDDEIYEYFFRQFVYTTYPVQEPIVLENPYKLEAVFRLSQGVGAFIPWNNTHKLKSQSYLLIAEKDQYFKASEFESFWERFPKNTKAGLFYVKNSEHKIPEAQPEQAAEIVEEIFFKE